MVYPITRLWLYTLCRFLIKRIKGMDNLPNKTPFIIASNHEKFIDPLYIIYPILRKLNKKIHFIARPTWWFLGERICRKWAGCIPLADPKEAYSEARQLLKAGEVVGIFPEGSIQIKKIKTGAVRLALETKTPIVPIGIKSSYCPQRTTLNIGNLIYIKDNKNIKKQTEDLIKYIYRLRNNAV